MNDEREQMAARDRALVVESLGISGSLIDAEYAYNQLKTGMRNAKTIDLPLLDRVSRAMDALERVIANLKGATQCRS